MTETKHTPGPWVWREVGGQVRLGTAHHGFMIVIDANRKGEVVTRGRNGILRAIVPEHPNARLIAAAPNMFEALDASDTDLTMLVTAIAAGDPSNELIVRAEDIRRRQAAAIAKARGEENQ